MKKLTKMAVAGVLTVGLLAGVAPTESSAASWSLNQEAKEKTSNKHIFKTVFKGGKFNLANTVKDHMNFVDRVFQNLSKKP